MNELKYTIKANYDSGWTNPIGQGKIEIQKVIVFFCQSTWTFINYIFMVECFDFTFSFSSIFSQHNVYNVKIFFQEMCHLCKLTSSTILSLCYILSSLQGWVNNLMQKLVDLLWMLQEAFLTIVCLQYPDLSSL